MAIIGYARVSTTEQNITTQIEALNAAGCEKIFQEKVSGAKRERPELDLMLDYVREGDTVVCTKLDRIARGVKDLWDIIDNLQKKGVGFRTLNNSDVDTTTATGKLMLSILGAVAEFEREMMLERQRDGIAVAKAEGKYTGRKPTARAKSAKVLELAAQGMKRKDIALKLGIGVASVYRALRA